MRTLVLVAALVVCVPGLLAAQSPAASTEARSGERPDEARTTAAAIEAVVRADYTKAATLLKPLVDNWNGSVSEAAAFFLATLYENGLGVPQDLPRACALYTRVYSGTGPFARLAEPLARAQMTDRLNPEQTRECVMLANVGVNHGFAPARFSLDADRSVAIELSNKKQEVVATVSQQGEEKTFPLQAALGSGSVFLPIEHTVLEWPRGSGSLRHFVEVAAWVPLPDARWQLAWTLAEIADKQVLTVAEGALTTIVGETRPSDVSVRLRELVTLEVNEAGSVEFAILNGTDATRERVPDVVERREREDELQRRRAADQKVNWKRRRDPGRAPSFAYTDSQACGGILLSGWSAERAESIAIRADRFFLEQTPSPRSFDLAALPPEIEVVVNVFEQGQRGWSACSDVTTIGQDQNQETWRAVSGTMRIDLSPAGARDGAASPVRATIQIDDAEFRGPAGTSRAAQPIKVSAVAVGPVP